MGFFDRILPTKRIEASPNTPPKQYYSIKAKLLHTKKIEAANDGTPSSMVGDSSEFFIITPLVPFAKAWEYYTTVPKVANVVEDNITEIQARDWYFDLKEDDTLLKTLNEWHAKFNLDRIKDQVLRDWLVCGTNIMGKSDWQPLQLSSVLGVKRDKNGSGKIVKILQQPRNTGAKANELDPEDFIISPYIEYDRKAFGASLITALASTFIYDNGEKNTSLPILSIDRIMLQDMGRIHHRFASPKRIIAFDDANQELIDRDVAPLIEGQGPGDTLVINQLPEQLNDNLDGKSRYDEDVQRVEDTVDIGLQSSTNRVITKPSSMADTGEAGAQDDSRQLGIMKKLSQWFNNLVLPEIIGEKAYDALESKEVFKFGTKDRMEVNPSELHQWILDGVMGKGEVREILRNTGTKLDDVMYEKDMKEKEQQRQDMMGMKMQKPGDNKKDGPEEKKEPEPPKE